jgi:alpha-hemolysin translocation ATP-binding protein hlyB
VINWQRAAKSIGLKVRLTNKEISHLPLVSLPVLVWDEKESKHFILARIDQKQGKYLIHDLEKITGRVIPIRICTTLLRTNYCHSLPRFGF